MRHTWVVVERLKGVFPVNVSFEKFDVQPFFPWPARGRGGGWLGVTDEIACFRSRPFPTKQLLNSGARAGSAESSGEEPPEKTRHPENPDRSLARHCFPLIAKRQIGRIFLIFFSRKKICRSSIIISFLALGRTAGEKKILPRP